MQITHRITFLLLTLTLAAATLTACANKTVADSTDNLEQADDQLSIKKMAGQFTGILPCADCGGWNTQLDLATDGKFKLTEQSLDEHEAQFVETTGTWTIEDGPIPFIALRATDANDEEPRYYEIVSRERLIFVGLDKQQIETELDYNLTRVDTP